VIPTELAAYLALFGLAFVAATLLPAQSEVALAAMVASGRYEIAFLILAATLGNVLGSLTNWLIGRFLASQQNARWFPVSRRALEKAQDRYKRWGAWTLLLSWMPIIGDPLTLVAGLLRTPLWLFLALVTIAKLGRYIVVAGAAFAAF